MAGKAGSAISSGAKKGFALAKASASAIASGLGTVGRSAYDAAKSVGSSTFSSAKDLVSDGFSSFGDGLTRAGKYGLSTAKSVVGTAENAAYTIFTYTMRKVNKIFNVIENIGSGCAKLIGGFTDCFSDGVAQGRNLKAK